VAALTDTFEVHINSAAAASQKKDAEGFIAAKIRLLPKGKRNGKTR
jgi:hypothetical protein